jgi:hypothetical protein
MGQLARESRCAPRWPRQTQVQEALPLRRDDEGSGEAAQPQVPAGIEGRMTEITQILRFGRAYSVALACGHKFRATPEEAQRDQLCIGKMVRCHECEEK